MEYKFKCWHRSKWIYYVNFRPYLKGKNFNFCKNITKANPYLLNHIMAYCAAKHSADNCFSNIYKLKTLEYKSKNSTKLNLIPISSKHLSFVETYKTDTNEMIYNLGGVMSLWFGIYPLSIVYFFEFCRKTIRRIKWKQIYGLFKFWLCLIMKVFLHKTKAFIIIIIYYLLIKPYGLFKFWLYLIMKVVLHKTKDFIIIVIYYLLIKPYGLTKSFIWTIVMLICNNQQY